MINKSPFESMSLDDCLKYASKGSAIILYEDGIYAAMAGTAIESKMNTVASDYKVYVLKEDLMQRGIDKLISGVTEVDYAGFVDLVEEHKTCSW
ncbi:MAG: sulfurtransferase complex subunit TusB [Actinobacteria bacterium]|nr:sulfurtransferase complex subunit TusB [Actinomycetota bacterium]